MLHNKMTKADYAVEFFLILFGICVCVVILYPILNMTAMSFSAAGPVNRGEVSLLPKGFTVEAYKAVLSNTKILRSFWNSIYLVIVSCVTRLTAVFLAAYPLVFCEFPGKKIWNIFIMVTMWVNAGTIPVFLCMKELGLVNTYWSLILGGLVSSYYVMIAKNFLYGLPAELAASARIDGAGELRIMLQVMLPLSKPLLATLAIWVISATWNAYMAPTIYLTDSAKFTLQQVLRSIVMELDMAAYGIDSAGSDINNMANQIRYAVLIVSMVPMAAMYPFAQKYFVKGVSVGAVKG